MNCRLFAFLKYSDGITDLDLFFAWLDQCKLIIKRYFHLLLRGYHLSKSRFRRVGNEKQHPKDGATSRPYHWRYPYIFIRINLPYAAIY